VLRFGRFKDLDTTHGRPANDSLEGAKVVYLAVLWPWALKAELLGPCIVAADAMHSKIKQGIIANIGMRIPNHYATLLTMWARSEDGTMWSTMFKLGVRYLSRQLKFGTTLISDRGTALLSAAKEVMGDNVQIVYDRLHLMLNIAANFPELKKLSAGGTLKHLLQDVLYSRHINEANEAIKQLMTAWATVRPAVASEHPEPPVFRSGDDEEENDDDTDFPKPVSFIMAEQGQFESPEAYIRGAIGLDKFVASEMRFCNHDVPSTTAVESLGSFQSFTVRMMSISRAILDIIGAHACTFDRLQAEAQKLANEGQIIFVAWPTKHSYAETTAGIDKYAVLPIRERQEYKVTGLVPERGVDFTQEHIVRFYDEAAPGLWEMTSPRLRGCSGGCYLFQLNRAPCVHALAAAAHLYPGLKGKIGIKRRNVQINDAREEEGREYATFIESITADYYLVNKVLGIVKQLNSRPFIIPVLKDLRRGPLLKAIKDDEPPPVVKFTGHGGAHSIDPDPRFLQHGESVFINAAGSAKRRRMKKNTCRRCKADGLPGMNHTAKSPKCPLFKARSNGPQSAASGAGVVTSSGTPPIAPVTFAEGGAEDDDDDEEEEEEGNDDE